MRGAEGVADLLVPALEAGEEGGAELMAPHAARQLRGYNVFASLIRQLYLRRLLPGIFFTKDQDGELRKGLTTVLAGDVWRDDNLFQRKLWRSPRRRYELREL